MAIRHPGCKAHSLVPLCAISCQGSGFRGSGLIAHSSKARSGGVRFPLRKALGTGSSQLKRAATSALFESSGLARQMCTGCIARTVKSEPVMRFESVRKDGDPPSGLQGSLTRSRYVCWCVILDHFLSKTGTGGGLLTVLARASGWCVSFTYVVCLACCIRRASMC